MTLTLHVDGARWRAAQAAATTAYPDLVPVIKGNGYGFGRDLLCAEAGRLGVPMIAVGTYAEVPGALGGFGGDVLVMEPFRAPIDAGLPDLANDRLVHTITAREDLDALRGINPSARTVIEVLTSMNRFGAPVARVADLLAAAGGEGVTLHLPLGSGHVAEIGRVVEALAGVRAFFVSHTTSAELAELRRRFPDHRFAARVGTDLWLADRGAYEVRAHVLDVRPLAKGARVGYRQRPQPGGHLLVVSGGTSHGVAMESPAAAATTRGRAIAVAEGVLEAAHRVRSPFTVSGTMPRFAEPPHMQCSLLVLPDGVAPPRIGDTVPVRMRLTTAYPDAVVLT
ncbi:alanine racemase [Intrasporangium sp.]|uniref:alanine racemase n=1 Tax=Intrasporangium sp. TaxID=1925024 RepID=UPI00293B6F7C|nr:alanine racemase [Intrasporangium sp.]MDV3220076.1 alanine racemase [Intrasporangium sp.]